MTPIIIVRSRTDQQPTERPYLRRAQRISYASGNSYRPLWTAENEQAKELAPAEARALLAWLRKSKFGAGYQYSAPGLVERPYVCPRAKEQARQERLVLKALAELGATRSGALASRCGLSRHQVACVLDHLQATGAAQREGDKYTGTWSLTDYGHWVLARRRLVAQIAGRPGWVVQEAPHA